MQAIFWFHSVIFKVYTGFICPCSDYYSHIKVTSSFTPLRDRIESVTVSLIGDPSLTLLLTLSLFAITMVTALNWLPVLRFQWLRHIPHIRHHLPTVIVWNFPTLELILSVLGLFPSTSHLWNFLPASVFPSSTFLPSKHKSVTTLRTI